MLLVATLRTPVGFPKFIGALADVFEDLLVVRVRVCLLCSSFHGGSPLLQVDDDLLRRRDFAFKQGRTGLGDFFILRRAFRAAHANRADDLSVMNNRHATLQGREIR